MADLTQLLSPTFVYMLFCYFMTLAVRKGFERQWPKLKTSQGWTDFLPVIPVIFGVLFAYIPKYPIPPIFTSSQWSKAIWGFVVGAVSTWAYAILQAVFKRLFGVDINLMRSIRPPPAPLPPSMTVATIPPPARLGHVITTEVPVTSSVDVEKKP